ncbi:hypothetical protein DSAG12_03232 [Promethearchaeum syntrophicum]|uniref:Uncharacterized protein n=1 Tax=Promethearchaeum syntrophicum TaxID=2594042 RepID=A0A5B9DFC1_9ARCH|nr:hypothetical protein [Candidatus Prometheoarchaeum syntrophicum]QEE17397.1 hypothetical protein DSAG12_03232 [Candidatus Prometheoarchaeum syntrophicum]
MSVKSKIKENTDKKKRKKDDLFKSQINYQLWGLFSMYKRLSLSELSDKLKKSKSTIHPYIKDYLERDIIEVKEEKQVRGNIKAKIYGFKKGYHERIFSCSNDKNCLEKKEFDKEFGNKIVRENIMKTKLYIKNLETQLKFFEKILNSGINGPDERALNILKEIYELDPAKNSMFKKKSVYSIVAYNSKDSHHLLHQMMNELVIKFNEATAGEEDEFPDLEKPYYFLSFGMPLKKMMEYLKS